MLEISVVTNYVIVIQYLVKERSLNAVVLFRPCLSWRDVQHIIAISSVKVCEHAYFRQSGDRDVRGTS